MNIFAEELIKCRGAVKDEGCPDDNLVLSSRLGFFEIPRCSSCKNKFDKLKSEINK